MGELAHQWGFAAESTYGTYVAPTQFLEINKASVKRRPNTVSVGGIRPSRRFGAAPQQVTSEDAGGSFESPVYVNGMGLIFKHLLGAVATVQPDIPNSPTVYSHAFTPGNLTGKSLTLQSGVDIISGAAVPITHLGAKILSATFSVDKDGLLQVTVNVDARKETTSESLAAASYAATSKVFTWKQGVVKKDNTAIATVKALNDLTITNALKVDRWLMNGTGLKAEPVNQPSDQITGSFTMEFAGLADVYTPWVNLTAVDIDLEFTGDVISDTETELLTIAMPNSRFTGDTPTLESNDLQDLTVPFQAFDPSSGSAITITLQNTDVSY